MRAAILLLLLAGTFAHAQTPSQAIDEMAQIQNEARAAQQRIDAVHARQLALVQERQLIAADGTRHALRNRELEQRVDELTDFLRDLDADLAAVSETQTGIVTLLLAMTDTLARFIELDLPFRFEQRRATVSALRASLTGADLSISAKYQAVISTYRAEIAHGTSNEVYAAVIDTAAGARNVHVVRLGRAGLWYVTPDGAHAGRWHKGERHWVDDGHTRPVEVTRAVRMLLQQGPVTAVSLPVDLSP